MANNIAALPLGTLTVLAFALSLVFIVGHGWTWSEGNGNAAFTFWTGALALGGAACLVLRVAVTGEPGQALTYFVRYVIVALLTFALAVFARVFWQILLGHPR